MAYYEKSLLEIEKALRKRFPEAHPQSDTIETDPPSYLLWMIQEMWDMDTSSLKSATKAARWIGYICRWVEELDLWDNTHSRDLIRSDVHSDLDVPVTLR